MLHSFVSPILVGRAAHVAAFAGVLERAAGGAGGVVLVSGEAGIGKSRLVATAAGEARERGFLVLQGTCFEADRSLPYAPLLDLARTFALAHSPAVARHVLEPAAPELLALAPDLAAVFPDRVEGARSDADLDEQRVAHAAARMFARLAGTQPLLVVLEDVHWADRSSYDLILHLARLIPAHPIVLAVTYRSDEVGPQLARCLAGLDRVRTAAELALARLTRDEVAAMVEAILGGGAAARVGLVERIHRWTDGNPFFVEEVLGSLAAAGRLGDDAGAPLDVLERVPVPRSATDAVRRRLDRLDEPTRRVAAVAAVAGRRFDFAVLRELTGHDAAGLLRHIERLIEEQLVVEESTERFAFRHALTREAVYAGLLARERAALHGRVAAAIEAVHGADAGARVEDLAHHTFEAGEWARALEFGRRAGERALAVHAPAEALAHLVRALEAARRAGVEPSAALHLARGRAWETLGELDRARADFDAALGRARAAGDRRAEWDALVAIGRVWASRDYARTAILFREALALARGLEDRVLVARSLNRVGNWHLNVDEPHAALRHHAEALAIFEATGDRRGIAETVDLIALAHYNSGEPAAAAAHYERAIALFRELDDRRRLANALAMHVACGPAFMSSVAAPADAAGIAAAAREALPVQAAREIGWRAGEAFALVQVAGALAWRGEFLAAHGLAAEALAIAEALGHLQWQCSARCALGLIHLGLLSVAGAREHMERAHALAREVGSRIWLRFAAAWLGLACVRAGDLACAGEVLGDGPDDAAAAGSPARAADHAARTLAGRQLLASRAELALARGEPGAALEVLDVLLGRGDGPRPLADAGRAMPRLALLRAEALAALGRVGEAEAALAAARAGAAAQDALPLLWRIEALHGRWLRRARRRADARAALARARSIIDGLAAAVPDPEARATFLREAAALVPPAAPASPRAAAKAAFGGLTKREREVAALVAQGKTNRAIARALRIGERTVEGYVANGLSKLGFRSRAQLAAWAVEKGLAAAE
jgi:DNA-binding CsgD family transcriptional regulator